MTSTFTFVFDLDLSDQNVAETKLEEHTQNCPPGLYRIFLTNATQQAFSVRSEEDVTQEDNIKTISKAKIMEDIAKRNVGSDFSPLRTQIEEIAAEEILIIYDYDYQFDKNFYLCLSNELKELIQNVSLPRVLQPRP